MQKLLIAGAVIIIFLAAIVVFVPRADAPDPVDATIGMPTKEGSVNDDPATASPDRLMDTAPADSERNPETRPTKTTDPVKFTGTLQAIQTDCFFDGVCSATVDGKEVVVLVGWNREEVGKIIGVDSIGDLETVVGRKVEVYAEPTANGYTLIGSADYYIKLLP